MRKLLVLAATALIALSLGGCAASDVAGEVTGSTCITDTSPEPETKFEKAKWSALARDARRRAERDDQLSFPE